MKIVTLEIPMYVSFDISESTDEDEETGEVPTELPPVKDLVAYLIEALVLDVDNEECGNPYGWCGIEVACKKAKVIHRE